MFCDLVASTTLSSQLDPEEYREVVRAYQHVCSEVLIRFDGHIAQLLGDGLLVYFGYPQAHEDDAHRAVRTGLGILDAMGDLNSRLQQAQGIQLAIRVMLQTLSEKHNSFLRPLKKKGFKEERVTTIGLYDIGKTHDPGIQQEPCQNTLCAKGSFLLDYCNRGCLPEVKQTIIDMSLNASGVRDTARSLHICPNTVLRALKKKATALESVNTSLLRTLNPAEVAWNLERAGEAEMDEMWSFVGNKGNPRWLWHAIDHHTGKVLAYVFGRRTDEVFLQLKALLEPFGLTRYYTDHWGAYTRHLDPDVHSPGKRNTQKIERKHLTLRTRIKRLVRKTI